MNEQELSLWIVGTLVLWTLMTACYQWWHRRRSRYDGVPPLPRDRFSESLRDFSYNDHGDQIDRKK